MYRERETERERERERERETRDFYLKRTDFGNANTIHDGSVAAHEPATTINVPVSS